MVDRRDIGSWLEGPRARTSAPGEYRGQRLGMPLSGPGSIAHFGRRLVGVVIDWLLCLLIANALWGVGWQETGGRSFIPLAVFAVENLLLVGTLGTTIGHRVVGIQVRNVAGGRAHLLQVVVRTVLLCLAIPALIWDRDGRGMHDRVANTVIVNVR